RYRRCLAGRGGRQQAAWGCRVWPASASGRPLASESTAAGQPWLARPRITVAASRYLLHGSIACYTTGRTSILPQILRFRRLVARVSEIRSWKLVLDHAPLSYEAQAAFATAMPVESRVSAPSRNKCMCDRR